jgi:acetylornithine/succinyldiaminopimelate/putrescine aminotransferase
MSVDRTGQFTYQQHSVAQPDAISLTKGVTSDIPIDVISAHEDLEFTKGEPKKKDPTIAEYCREHRSLVNVISAENTRMIPL